jgi:hypothetical protein
MFRVLCHGEALHEPDVTPHVASHCTRLKITSKTIAATIRHDATWTCLIERPSLAADRFGRARFKRCVLKDRFFTLLAR